MNQQTATKMKENLLKELDERYQSVREKLGDDHLGNQPWSEYKGTIKMFLKLTEDIIRFNEFVKEFIQKND